MISSILELFAYNYKVYLQRVIYSLLGLRNIWYGCHSRFPSASEASEPSISHISTSLSARGGVRRSAIRWKWAPRHALRVVSNTACTTLVRTHLLRLSLKRGTGNRGTGMGNGNGEREWGTGMGNGNGERGTGNGESLKWGIFKSGNL